MVKYFSLAAGLDPEAGKTNKEMTIRPTNTNKIFLIVFPPFCIVSIFYAFAFLLPPHFLCLLRDAFTSFRACSEQLPYSA